jgi:hypothetical protein
MSGMHMSGIDADLQQRFSSHGWDFDDAQMCWCHFMSASGAFFSEVLYESAVLKKRGIFSSITKYFGDDTEAKRREWRV